MKFSLLSINIWDLPVTLPGSKRRLRRRRLLDGLPAVGADLLLIQEAFRPALRAALDRALAGYHADHHAHRRRRLLGLPMDATGGLLTLARWQVTDTAFRPSPVVRGMKPDERIGRKGVLWTRVATPTGGLTVGNVHLYAGSGTRDARVRRVQARRLLRIADKLPRPQIVAGDFNITHETEQADRGATVFDLMRDAGFREVADGRSAGLHTWSPDRNPWARYMPWHHTGGRLTQVFYRGDGLRPTGPPRLVLHDPPVSDHFGLLVTFECSTG